MVSFSKEDIIPISKPLLPRLGEDPGALVSARTKPAVDKLRDQHEIEHDRKTNRMLAIGAAGLIAVMGALKGTDHFMTPKGKTVTEIVQPKDFQNPSLLAGRAEKQYGSDPSGFDLHQETLRIASQYGQLHVGEAVKVHIK